MLGKRSSAHVSSKDNIFVYRVASVKCSQIIFGKAIFHARIIKNIFRRRHIIMLSENHIYRFSLYPRKSFRCKLVYDFRRSFCFYRYPFALYLCYKLDFFMVFVRLSVFCPLWSGYFTFYSGGYCIENRGFTDILGASQLIVILSYLVRKDRQ